MINCKFPSEAWSYSLPVVEAETVLQFCKRLAILAELSPPTTVDTSPFILFQDATLLNSADKRHLKISAMADVRKDFMARLTEFANPSTVVMITGNLEEGDFEPALDECCICMEKFIERPGLFSGRILMLPCRHRFHKQCIEPQATDLCALCRTPFDRNAVMGF